MAKICSFPRFSSLLINTSRNSTPITRKNINRQNFHTKLLNLNSTSSVINGNVNRNKLTSIIINRKKHHSTIGFYEKDSKAGYGKEYSNSEALQEGMKDLKNEINKWKNEMKDKIAQDNLLVFPGDRDKVWVFDGTRKSPSGNGGYCSHPDNEASLINPTTSLNSKHDVETSGSLFDGWIVTSDNDHLKGFSEASLRTSPAGHALFSGNLNAQVPKDGDLHYSGFCNMCCIRPRRSFARDLFLDWYEYTHLIVRCRGDGRVYMLNVASSGSFDIAWNDMYHFPLYTRGGPHWQTYKIPFSRFMFSSKGSVQDKQSPLDSGRVTSMGITVADKNQGPFQLEIDFIAVENDPIHDEETAYEMYKMPNLYITP